MASIIKQKNFGYSLKNIPVPDEKVYRQMVIASADKTLARMRWRAWHYLNPHEPRIKNTFGFPTCNPAPKPEELEEFEEKFIELVKSAETTKATNKLQESLKNDVEEIKNSDKVFISADKTSNFYKMDPKKYEELLDNNITKEYKNTKEEAVKKVDLEDKALAEKLDIEDRVHRTTEREAFITIKDHKPNFRNNTKCRLINPAKPELGKVSKQILEKKVSEIKEKTKLTQFKNTKAVLEWFQGSKQKHKLDFIQFDVENFYPSITEELLENAITWAETIVTFTEEEKRLFSKQRNLSSSVRARRGQRKVTSSLM